MPRLEFFYDLSSPWTRIAFRNAQALVEETGAEFILRPILVGGVFNAVNQSVYAMREDLNNPKFRLTWHWLKEWADLAGVAMNFPSPHHPLKSVNAMRFCCAVEDDQAVLARFSEAAFEAYFGEQANLDDVAELVKVADKVGLDGGALATRIQDQDVKDRLRFNTQEVIDRGGFGSPTLFVNETRMYFGNDQLPLVRQALLNG